MTRELWKIDENEELPLAVIVDNERGDGVCEIGADGTVAAGDSAENWRRAYLIAAAPRMFAALEACIEAGALIQAGERNGAVMGMISAATDEARAVLLSAAPIKKRSDGGSL